MTKLLKVLSPLLIAYAPSLAYAFATIDFDSSSIGVSAIITTCLVAWVGMKQIKIKVNAMENGSTKETWMNALMIINLTIFAIIFQGLNQLTFDIATALWILIGSLSASTGIKYIIN